MILVKKWKLFIPILLSALLIGAKNCTAEFSVEADDKINYTIVQADLDVNIGYNSFQVSGINIDNNNIEEGYTLSAEVDTVSSVVTIFTYSARGHATSATVQFDAIEFMIPQTVHYAFSLFEMGANDWSVLEDSFEYGFNLLFIPTFVPFIDVTDTTWSWIDGYFASYSYFFATATFDHANYTMQYESKTKGDVFTAEWLVQMSDIRTNQAFNVDVTGSSHYKLSIQKSTGIILGSRYEGSCFGELNGLTVDVSTSLLFEEENYDMPGFKIGSASISPLFLLSGTTSIFIVAIITRKRKFRK